MKARVAAIDYSRQVSGAGEYTSGLAAGAGNALLAARSIDPRSVDYLIVCTQSPDFFLPTTACLVQDELGLRTQIGAVDINLGCSGYIYALGMAKGLIESGQVRNVLVITAETHRKLANPADRSARPVSGAAAATFVVADDHTTGMAGFVYGSDGTGGRHLVVPNDDFTLRVVTDCVEQVLSQAKLAMEDIDFFVFHQANGYLLEHLCKNLGIDQSKVAVAIEDVGGAGSAAIPIALARAEQSGSISAGNKVMVVGFGVGSSWGGAVIDWS